MESIIIQPRDKKELQFFIELAKRLGVKIRTYEELEDESLLKNMEKNKLAGKVDKSKVIDTLYNILNEDKPAYNNEG